MSIKVSTCPKCGAVQQYVAVNGSAYYACRCGHAEEHPVPTPPRHVVRYEQHVNWKRLTITLARPTDN